MYKGKSRSIFITGAQRSGTSWVAEVLSTSPDCHLIDEPFNSKRSKYINSKPIEGWFPFISRHNEEFYKKDIKSVVELNFGLTNLARDILNGSQPRKNIKGYFQLKSAKQRNCLPIIKQPTGLFMAPWMEKNFGSKILVMIRHPAAFVSSRSRLGWGHQVGDFLKQNELMTSVLAPLKTEIEELSNRNLTMTEQNAYLWKILYFAVHRYRQDFSNWIFEKYEDLSLDPVPEFKNIFEKLDIPFNIAAQAKVDELSSKNNPAESTKENWKSVKLDSKKMVDNWKKRLNLAEIKRIKSIVQPVSQYFYAESDW